MVKHSDKNDLRKKQFVLALSFREIQSITMGMVWQQETKSALHPKNRGVKFHSYTGGREVAFHHTQEVERYISPHTGSREVIFHHTWEAEVIPPPHKKQRGHISLPTGSREVTFHHPQEAKRSHFTPQRKQRGHISPTQEVERPYFTPQWNQKGHISPQTESREPEKVE